SRDHLVDGNLIGRARVGVRAANTSGLAVVNNRFIEVDTVVALRDTTRFTFAGNTAIDTAPWPRRFLRAPRELVDSVLPIAGCFMPSRPATSVASRRRSAVAVERVW